VVDRRVEDRESDSDGYGPSVPVGVGPGVSLGEADGAAVGGSVGGSVAGAGVSVADIAEALLALAERPLRLVVDPDLVRATDIPILVGDPTKLIAATGWSPSVLLAQTVGDVMTDVRRR